MPEVLDTYDYLIVGAGPAGCLLANRLSADPANRVLLLEAGGPDNYPWIHIPVGYLYCIGNPRTDWCFDTDEVPGLNGRSLKYPRGKVLGGCSSINGMIYMRPGPRLRPVGGRRQSGLELERAAAAVPQDGGPFRRDQRNARRRRRMAGRTPAALLEAARCLPAGGGADRNRQRRGFQRWRQRRLRLLPGQPARRGALECLERLPARHRPARQPDGSDPCRSPAGAPRGRPRQGLSVRWQGREQRFEARREIVLSAGAIGSPCLLQRSGIGPRTCWSGSVPGSSTSCPGSAVTSRITCNCA